MNANGREPEKSPRRRPKRPRGTLHRRAAPPDHACAPLPKGPAVVPRRPVPRERPVPERRGGGRGPAAVDRTGLRHQRGRLGQLAPIPSLGLPNAALSGPRCASAHPTEERGQLMLRGLPEGSPPPPVLRPRRRLRRNSAAAASRNIRRDPVTNPSRPPAPRRDIQPSGGAQNRGTAFAGQKPVSLVSGNGPLDLAVRPLGLEIGPLGSAVGPLDGRNGPLASGTGSLDGGNDPLFPVAGPPGGGIGPLRPGVGPLGGGSGPPSSGERNAGAGRRAARRGRRPTRPMLPRPEPFEGRSEDGLRLAVTPQSPATDRGAGKAPRRLPAGSDTAANGWRAERPAGRGR
jgi:hypothetical protein